jgi:pyridoxamine 5'-phosphate oxidase
VSVSPPSFYDNLDETLAESWRLIGRGTADRRSPFHHPTVATVGLDGAPKLRTVILRGCDVDARMLRFHTDARSEKAREITRNPRVGVHFYDPGAKIQLRIEGVAALNQENPLADAAWAGSRVFSRQCYGIAPGPGTAISEPDGFSLPDTTEDATASGRAHFTAVTVEVQAMEWLYLAAQGHRRARFAWAKGDISTSWLTP